MASELLTIESVRAALDAIRLQQDLTLERMAKDIGTTHPTLLNTLRGKSIPNDRTLYKMRQFIERKRRSAARAKARRSRKPVMSPSTSTPVMTARG